MKPRLEPALLDRASWLLLCALVFTLPFEKSVWVPGVGTIARALGLLALAPALLSALRRKSAGPPNIALLAAAAFTLWTALTFFWSLAPEATLARVFTACQLFSMFWLVWFVCRRVPGRHESLMAAYVAGSAVAAVLGLLRLAAGQQTYYRRYAAAGFDPNDFGLTLALSLPLALYLALRPGAIARWLCRVSAAMAIAAVLVTASRAAFIASCLAFLFVFWTWRLQTRAQRISNLALLALLLVGALWLAPSASRQRLATTTAELSSGTLHNRTRIWKAGLKVFLHRPLRGVGAGAFPKAVEPRLGTPAIPGHQFVAHNTFLSVLVECGMPGLGLFSCLLASLVLFLWAMPPLQQRLWSVTLMVWSAGVLTLTWENRKPTWLIFGLILAAWSHSFREDQ